jgi:hypothetical protein
MARKSTNLEVELDSGEFWDMHLSRLSIDRKSLLFDEGEKLLLWRLIDHIKSLRHEIGGYMISVHQNNVGGFVWFGNDPIDRTISIGV